MITFCSKAFWSFQNVSRRIFKDHSVGDSGLGDSGELPKENSCRRRISHIWQLCRIFCWTRLCLSCCHRFKQSLYFVWQVVQYLWRMAIFCPSKFQPLQCPPWNLQEFVHQSFQCLCLEVLLYTCIPASELILKYFYQQEQLWPVVYPLLLAWQNFFSETSSLFISPRMELNVF